MIVKKTPQRDKLPWDWAWTSPPSNRRPLWTEGEHWQLVTWDGEERQRGQRGQSDPAAEGSRVCDRPTLSLINQAQQ